MKASNRFIDDGYVQETPTGTINGANLVFTLAFVPDDSAGVSVYLNGILQRPTNDYSIVSQTITFVAAPAVAQDLRVFYTKRT